MLAWVCLWIWLYHFFLHATLMTDPKQITSKSTTPYWKHIVTNTNKYSIVSCKNYRLLTLQQSYSMWKVLMLTKSCFTALSTAGLTYYLYHSTKHLNCKINTLTYIEYNHTFNCNQWCNKWSIPSIHCVVLQTSHTHLQQETPFFNKALSKLCRWNFDNNTNIIYQSHKSS